MSDTPDSFAELINSMDAEVHQQLRTAIELGRWANGDKLSEEQRENSLQIVIAWEVVNLPEDERVGYIDRSKQKKTNCDD